MQLPSWLTLLLNHWHVDLDAFTVFAKGLLAKVDLEGTEAAAAIADFLAKADVAIQPGALLSLATAAWLELKSGNPGYGKDHAGLA